MIDIAQLLEVKKDLEMSVIGSVISENSMPLANHILKAKNFYNNGRYSRRKIWQACQALYLKAPINVSSVRKHLITDTGIDYGPYLLKGTEYAGRFNTVQYNSFCILEIDFRIKLLKGIQERCLKATAQNNINASAAYLKVLKGLKDTSIDIFDLIEHSYNLFCALEITEGIEYIEAYKEAVDNRAKGIKSRVAFDEIGIALNVIRDNYDFPSYDDDRHSFITSAIDVIKKAMSAPAISPDHVLNINQLKYAI